MLNKQKSIISSLKGTESQVIKKNIKFGIRVPQTFIEALRLDKKNGNNLWSYGITKDINAVMIVFKLRDEG